MQKWFRVNYLHHACVFCGPTSKTTQGDYELDFLDDIIQQIC